MPDGITQCYLLPGRADILAFTPAEAGTWLSDPGGMQGWVDLVDDDGVVHTATPLTTRYKFVAQTKNLDDAHAYCLSQYNARLVIIANQIDQLRLHSYIDTLNGQLLGVGVGVEFNAPPDTI